MTAAAGAGPILYAFEDITPDLPRPPLAAMRGLLSAGTLISRRGWETLSTETRWAIARQGAQPEVSAIAIQGALRTAPVAEIRLVPRVGDPSPEQVPPVLAAAL